MNNISKIHDCYGCGVCSAICPYKLIDIKLNKDGFYEPTMHDVEKCTNCGLCLSVCAYNHTEISSAPSSSIKSYAAWSKDKNTQNKCSSGGAGFEIGKLLIQEGYKVCAVKYNPNLNRAEHYIASTKEELIQSIGSKYIQSFTPNAFQSIDKSQKYLVTGTPCQIDSFRRFIRKKRIEEKFILLDFFCHSVPSIHAWQYYTRQVEKKVGKITYASWRNKITRWHDSWVIGIFGTNNQEPIDSQYIYNTSISEQKNCFYSKKSEGDLFYKLFLGDFCCNPACSNKCKYKYDSSAADIRIGDLWGKTYDKNEDGVSALVCFTSKGQDVVEHLSECTLIEHPFHVVAEGQMKKNVGKATFAPLMKQCLKYNAPLFITKGVIFLERISNKIQRILK